MKRAWFWKITLPNGDAFIPTLWTKPVVDMYREDSRYKVERVLVVRPKNSKVLSYDMTDYRK